VDIDYILSTSCELGDTPITGIIGRELCEVTDLDFDGPCFAPLTITLSSVRASTSLIVIPGTQGTVHKRKGYNLSGNRNGMK
jgi:hypothetical protein